VKGSTSVIVVFQSEGINQLMIHLLLLLFSFVLSSQSLLDFQLDRVVNIPSEFFSGCYFFDLYDLVAILDTTRVVVAIEDLKLLGFMAVVDVLSVNSYYFLAETVFMLLC
jgi:hypothetical protein